MEKLTVEKDIWIDAPIARVWQAVTSDVELMKWWGDTWEIPRLELGAELKFGEPGEMMSANIERLDPPREFVIRWPPQEAYHNIEMLTIFELEEENGGTRLKVTETGFEALAEDIRQKRYESTAKGYETVLGSLKAFVEGAK